MTMTPHLTQTFGNHEFDHYVPDVVKFLGAVKSPVLACNIDDTEEPTMQGKYQKSIIIDRYDRKIGIIGVVLSTFNVSGNRIAINKPRLLTLFLCFIAGP